MNPLEKARAASAALRDAGIDPVRLDPIEKSRANPTSLRLAINGKCWDCVGAGSDPNPRATIRECAITECTLHPVRPFQSKTEVDCDAPVSPPKSDGSPDGERAP